MRVGRRSTPRTSLLGTYQWNGIRSTGVYATCHNNIDLRKRLEARRYVVLAEAIAIWKAEMLGRNCVNINDYHSEIAWGAEYC